MLHPYSRKISQFCWFLQLHSPSIAISKKAVLFGGPQVVPLAPWPRGPVAFQGASAGPGRLQTTHRRGGPEASLAALRERLGWEGGGLWGWGATKGEWLKGEIWWIWYTFTYIYIYMFVYTYIYIHSIYICMYIYTVYIYDIHNTLRKLYLFVGEANEQGP